MRHRAGAVPADLHETTYNLFGLGSAIVGRAMAVFAGAYLLMLVGTCREIRSVAVWVSLAGGFALFVVAATLMMRSEGAQMPRGTGAAVAVVTVAGVTLSFWSLPVDTYMARQTTPAASAMTILLALIALYGRPVTAWLGALSATALAAVGGALTGIGPAVGAGNTNFCYPVLAVATLFSVMMTSMPERLRSIRERAVAQAAAEAATRAAAAERDFQMRRLDARARSILHKIIDGHHFTDEEALEARLTEAELRDAIRAPAWSSAATATAVWSARRRGVSVRLLDDGALADKDEEMRSRVVGALLHVLRELEEAGAASGTVTARILPAGRDLLASVVVDVGQRRRRIEVGQDGTAMVIVDSQACS